MHGIDLDACSIRRETAEDGIAATGLPGRHRIGCFGRVRHQKGTDLFVEAMIALLPQLPGLDGGHHRPRHGGASRLSRTDSRKRSRRPGLGERILFLGEVPDIKVWYRRLTLYVAPSRNEGFGLTPLEAMASRTAVVASDAGAYAELDRSGGDGLGRRGRRRRGAREAIRPYLAEPLLAVAAGQAGLAHVEARFPLEREAEAIGAVYRLLWAGEAVSGAPRPSANR